MSCTDLIFKFARPANGISRLKFNVRLYIFLRLGNCTSEVAFTYGKLHTDESFGIIAVNERRTVDLTDRSNFLKRDTTASYRRNHQHENIILVFAVFPRITK